MGAVSAAAEEPGAEVALAVAELVAAARAATAVMAMVVAATVLTVAVKVDSGLVVATGKAAGVRPIAHTHHKSARNDPSTPSCDIFAACSF